MRHLLFLLLIAAACSAQSLEFFDYTGPDVDRVKIRVDDETNSLPGPVVDVGAMDFTIEFWMKASPDNDQPAVACGANINWIYGNIMLDRDRYNQDRKFGLSIAGDKLIFGVSGDGTGDRTICGVTDVTDNVWHHIAIGRRRSDGFMYLLVDGNLESSANGPDGDISYPDDGIPGNYCNGPCDYSDPFIVLGVEKHDADPANYPGFTGNLTELRISDTLRYVNNYPTPAARFTSDARTLGLYHFTEGAGDTLHDSSNHPQGPNHGIRYFGGTPAGPLWSIESPFADALPAINDLTLAVDSGTATLRWSAIPGAVNYLIYRSASFEFTPPGEGTFIGSTTASEFSFELGAEPFGYFRAVAE
ncbi:MAG: LamG domain-containing protein [bacterium]|nr:LamG domain-containing protein [bacterium]